MTAIQLIKNFVNFIPILRGGIFSDNHSIYSAMVQARIDQAFRNETPLTVFIFDPCSFPEKKSPLFNYVLQRLTLALSIICIRCGVVFYFLEKELSLILEATTEDAEIILTQTNSKLKEEDIRLKYKTQFCFNNPADTV